MRKDHQVCVRDGFSETPTITLGSTRCTSEWVSATSILCRVPPGVGSGLQVLVNVESQAVSVTRAWSYNAPALSSISPVAGSTTGAISVTLSGSDFGTAGNAYNPSSAIGSTSCTTAIHVLGTSVVCKVAPEISEGLTSSVVVSEQTGVQTLSFSYTAPAISSVTRTSSGATVAAAAAAMAALEEHDVFAVYLEGVELGRGGTIAILQVRARVRARVHLCVVTLWVV